METGHEKFALAYIFWIHKFKKLAMKFEPAQIIRKPTQVITSLWSNEALVDTS